MCFFHFSFLINNTTPARNATNNNTIIVHRIEEKTELNGSTYYITKGDANNSKDDPIDEKQIIGVVVKILPTFGFFKKTLFKHNRLCHC